MTLSASGPRVFRLIVSIGPFDVEYDRFSAFRPAQAAVAQAVRWAAARGELLGLRVESARPGTARESDWRIEAHWDATIAARILQQAALHAGDHVAPPAHVVPEANHSVPLPDADRGLAREWGALPTPGGVGSDAARRAPAQVNYRAVRWEATAAVAAIAVVLGGLFALQARGRPLSLLAELYDPAAGAPTVTAPLAALTRGNGTDAPSSIAARARERTDAAPQVDGSQAAARRAAAARQSSN